MPKRLRIATRQSPLALWQANHVRNQLLTTWPDLNCTLVPLVTSGDKFQRDRLQSVGGKGLFVKELEEALLDDRADIAVHSTKDMPATLPEGLHLPIICKRDNPLDALLSKTGGSLDELQSGAIVGTASLRRQSQLLAYRPDLQVQTLRGNIQTRIEKWQEGPYQAIILAAAGLERMGLQSLIAQYLPDTLMLPACAQGALSIETRIEDEATESLIACLHHPDSALCVQTERQVNAQLGGNCQVPLAVYCTLEADESLWLRAKLLSADGRQTVTASQRGERTQAAELAKACTEALFAEGATALLTAG